MLVQLAVKHGLSDLVAAMGVADTEDEDRARGNASMVHGSVYGMGGGAVCATVTGNRLRRNKDTEGTGH